MADKKDILVGLKIKEDESPEVTVQQFDGENRNIDYSQLIHSFNMLETDLKTIYQKFSSELSSIKTKTKSF